MLRFLIAIVVMLILVGCSFDYKCAVQSNTEWSGSFGNRTVDGSGNQIVDLPDEEIQCVVVQKETREGILSIKLIKEGHGIFNSDDENPTVTTTAEYGIVSDCIE